MNWINLADLVLVHEQVIDATGGVHGIINPAALESALVRPFTSLGGEDMFPNLWSKVAALIHSIITFHPFADGNKRTALIAADVCLKLNGFKLVGSEGIAPFFWAIARGEKSLEEIITWLKTHTEVAR